MRIIERYKSTYIDLDLVFEYFDALETIRDHYREQNVPESDIAMILYPYLNIREA